MALLILGLAALIFTLIGFIFDRLAKKQGRGASSAETEQKEPEPEPVPAAEEKEEAPMKEPAPAEKKEEPKQEPVERAPYVPKSERSYSSSIYDSSYSTVYVKMVGYGPLLRVEGPRILDMRNNIYYRIEGDKVMQDGSGLRYEIRGNQIRDAFGGYLYELSGSNINKVYGGFYASISGNYITLYDSSRKFETTGSLSKKQTLVVAALLFGND